jgi:hypothetical protein
MNLKNYAHLSPAEMDAVRSELGDQNSVLDLHRWSQRQPYGVLLPEVIAERVVQDEFTQDLIVPWRDGLVLVYEATCLGAVTAIAIWDSRPTADELLQRRLLEGWQPTPSLLADGEQILGYAACIFSNARSDS